MLVHTLKNRILLENYFLPGDLEAQIEAFVHHYNHQRYHESIKNVTPADVYFGRDKALLKQHERINRTTLETRCLHHRQHVAKSNQPDEPNSFSVLAAIGSKKS